MQGKGMVTINNMPGDHDRYVVAKVGVGALWFWTSWANEDDAAQSISADGMEDEAVVIDTECGRD